MFDLPEAFEHPGTMTRPGIKRRFQPADRNHGTSYRAWVHKGCCRRTMDFGPVEIDGRPDSYWKYIRPYRDDGSMDPKRILEWDGDNTWIGPDIHCSCAYNFTDVYRYRLVVDDLIDPDLSILYFEMTSGGGCSEIAGEWRNKFFYRGLSSNPFRGGMELPREKHSCPGLFDDCEVCIDSFRKLTQCELGSWPACPNGMTADLPEVLVAELSWEMDPAFAANCWRDGAVEGVDPANGWVDACTGTGCHTQAEYEALCSQRATTLLSTQGTFPCGLWSVSVNCGASTFTRAIGVAIQTGGANPLAIIYDTDPGTVLESVDITSMNCDQVNAWITGKLGNGVTSNTPWIVGGCKASSITWRG